MSDTPIDPEPAGYAEAVGELEAILDEIENDEVDVDRLAAHVERAAVLIEYCRGRIVAARSAVEASTPTPAEGDD